MTRIGFMAVLLLGCKPDPSTPGVHEETVGTTGPTGGTTGSIPCDAELVDSDPWDGQGSVYYRSELTVWVTEEGSRDVAIGLVDANGESVPAAVSWDETDTIATIAATDPLAPDESYTLQVDACEVSHGITFTTSVYGGDLIIPASDLIGNAYFFDMSGANYVKPAGFGALVGIYLSEPLLIGVVDANEQELTLLGGQGRVQDTTGDIVQNTSFPTWDFGTADFTESPYFSAFTDEFLIEYDGVEIPVYGFSIEGTFEPDGSSIGGGSGRGLADTREMGSLLGSMVSDPDDPNAMCELAATFNFECETCPDGEPLCMTIEGEFDPAVLIGDELEEVAPTE